MSALSEERKKYIQENKLEETITDAVNKLLISQQQDPYSFLAKLFSQKAKDQITIEDIQSFQILNNDFMPQIKINITIRYQDQIKLIQSPITSNSVSQEIGNVFLFDEDQSLFQGKGMKKAQEIIKTLLQQLKKKNIDSVDVLLEQHLNENQNHLNLIFPISFSIPLIKAITYNQQPYQLYQKIFEYNTEQKIIPKLFVNLLQGSKLIGSKSKIYRIMLIISEGQPLEESLSIINQVTANVRKTIVQGKQGEAALKYYQDGTFICPVDTIVDNLKLVEDAINQTPYKDKCGVGISWQADLFYNPEKKNYELDNPKQLLDTDQLIDFYYKLSTEKQMILYMEDPICSTDIMGWQKLLAKFKDSKVKFGSRKLYTNLQSVKNNYIPFTLEDYPDLTPEQIQERNSSQIQVDYIFLRPYELGTFNQFKQIVDIITLQNKHIIVGSQLSDTLDTNYVDLAFGIMNSVLNINPPLKYEKVMKFNRIMEIMANDQ